MAFTKITNTELNARGATTLPNQPTISATALKQEFDAPAKNVVAPKFNNLIDELESTTASASLGAVAPSGHTGSTVQAVINSIASEVGTLEGQIPVIAAQAHSHPNKDLLDTYTQTNADITQAIADDHTHSNKALLDTYSNTNEDITTAIASTHSHSNKNLLDTYNQSNADIEDAIAKKHTHSNKALLDTYTQTESDLSDAVSKKHTHSNKTVIDKFGEDSSGNPTYDGNPIGGGGTGNVNDAYKTVKVGLTSLVASGEDTLILKGGSNVTLVADNLEKSITINSTGGGGQSTGDMLAADYDSDFDVKNAGGIKAFVNSAATYTGESGVVVSNKKIKADLANYTSSPLASANISTTQNRQYAVGLDANDHLSVNVPWEDTTYNDATTSASGLMSATDKTKLNSLDTVVANPAGTASADLTKLQIGNTIYEIKGGGGGTTIVQIPSVVGDSFTYNGISQGPTITGLDSTHCTVTGATAVNAGSYTLTIALNDPSTMVWSDLTTADKTYSYTIAKASQTLTASKNSVSLTAQQPSDTVTISGQQGSLNVSSSDTGIATVSESSGVVTITGVYNGSATVSVYAEETANYTQSNTVSISANVMLIDSVLNNNSWDIIQSVAQAGTGANYWSVGDRKEVALNGTVRARTLSNYKWYAYILGFNHNQAKEGTAIHFQFGFSALTGGVHTVLTDWTSTATYGDNTSGVVRFCINDTGTNVGGWNGSLMRGTTIPQFKNCLPSALKSVLKAVTKYTDNTGNASNQASDVTATSDEIFLLSEYEVFGVRTNANQYEYTDGKQAQYAYYANSNSKVMYNDQVTNTAVIWWTRSCDYEHNNNGCAVSNTGETTRSGSNRSLGFAPAFAVG